VHIQSDSTCAICGSIRQLEVHHIEPRRMGGSRRPEIEADENKIILCRTCHAHITEQRWRIERGTDRLSVTDVASGRLVSRRHTDPSFQAAAYFAELQYLDDGLRQLILGIPYLTDDQLVDLFGELRALDQRTWMAQAAILWEAKRRSVYGDRAWEAMGRGFGIGWRQAYNLARVWEVFFAGKEGEFCIQMQNSPLAEVSWYIAACETADPHFWLQYAEDRKAEDPNYTISDFREEIRAAGAEAERDTLPDDQAQRCRWIRVYCAKLGRVVTPGRCPGCDAGVPAVQEVVP
jgi:HNH endonuclease